jgi:hypothetical protein
VEGWKIAGRRKGGPACRSPGMVAAISAAKLRLSPNPLCVFSPPIAQPIVAHLANDFDRSLLLLHGYRHLPVMHIQT